MKQIQRIFLLLPVLMTGCSGHLEVLKNAKTGDTWSGTKQLGVAGTATFGESVATDASGNVFVTGLTSGDLDGNTLTRGVVSFVTKYSADGTKQWTRQLGVDGTGTGTGTSGRGVATDAGGNVFVAGDTGVPLDGNTLTTGRVDSFITKYGVDGARQWTRQLGVDGTGTDGKGVATDANGNVFVAGYTSGGLDGNTLTGKLDCFVTKYGADGARQWTRQLSVDGTITLGESVATDVSGNVFVAGSAGGGLDGNTRVQTIDFFVTKYSADGTKQWTRRLGVEGTYTYGNGVATDAGGNVFVAGSTYGPLDGNALTGTRDFFVTKYGADGARQWTRQLGVSGTGTDGKGVATDAGGNVFVTGHTFGPLDGNTFTGPEDFFVTKYGADGARQWTRQLGVSGTGTDGSGVATDASGNVFVAGSTGGGLDGNTLTGTRDFFVTKYDANGVKQ